MKKLYLVALLALAILLGVSDCAQAALTSSLRPKIAIPEGYEQFNFISQMGWHWANMAVIMAQSQANEPLGPIYLVYKGEVIGLEWMWTEQMTQEVNIIIDEGLGPEAYEPLPSLVLPPLPVGVTMDHIDIGFLPRGHGGMLEEPHWHLHLYFITEEEKAGIVLTEG